MSETRYEALSPRSSTDEPRGGESDDLEIDWVLAYDFADIGRATRDEGQWQRPAALLSYADREYYDRDWRSRPRISYPDHASGTTRPADAGTTWLWAITPSLDPGSSKFTGKRGVPVQVRSFEHASPIWAA